MDKSLTRPGGLACRLRFFALFLIMSWPAHAHSPLFPRENHDIASAFLIENPAKSWVAYSAIRTTGRRDYYQFQASPGDEIRVKLLASADPSQTLFLPSFALAIPGYHRGDSLPPDIVLPHGYGIILVRGVQPQAASYEPFAQGWFYDLAVFSTLAPAAGTYYLIVFDPLARTGGYALTLGYLERWTPLELIALPWNIRRIQIWEGQSLMDSFIPFLAALLLGSIWLLLRRNGGKTPHTLSQGFAAFSFLAFLGSSASSIHQMLLASRIAPIHRSDLIVTLIAAAIPLVLGILALRYGLRGSSGRTVVWQIGLTAIAVVGLIFYTGLYLGPVLCLLAAVTKTSEKSGLKRLEN